MRKSGIALAVGALFAAPAAFAQATDKDEGVTVYGKLYPQLARTSSTGATAVGSSVSTVARRGDGAGTLTAASGSGTDLKGRYSVDVANSYIGFRGQHGLGAGTKAIWQIETATEFDTGTGIWATRNSFVGLEGGFGTVKLGIMDTIYKDYGDVFSVLGISSGNFVSNSNIFSQTGFTTSAARFHERAPNSAQYETPAFGGMNFGVQYSPGEANGNPGTTEKKSLWSYGVKYEAGPLYASVQHEIHNDFFGGSSGAATLSNAATADAHSKDKATRVSIKYKLGSHQISAGFANMRYDETGQVAAPSKFKSYKHNTWALQWEARWSPAWRTVLQFTQAGAGSCEVTVGGCSTEGLDGRMYAGAVGYSFSRRTFGYLIASRLMNGHSALYDNWANGTPTTGADVTQIGLGVSHTF